MHKRGNMNRVGALEEFLITNFLNHGRGAHGGISEKALRAPSAQSSSPGKQAWALARFRAIGGESQKPGWKIPLSHKSKGRASCAEVII